MDQVDKPNLEKYGVKDPAQKEQELKTENELWEKLVDDPDNEQHHKDYVGHVLRSGLFKEASRRYGPMVEDKEKYSIEARRMARMYQKQIVNLMFMTPAAKVEKKKNPTLGYMIAFIAMMAILTGLMVRQFWYIAVVGFVYLAIYIYIKFEQSKKATEKKKNIQNPTDML